MSREDILAWIMRPNSRLIAKTLDRGWIEPGGQFWGVPSGGHSVLMERGFKMYGNRPIEEGWVCVGERPEWGSGMSIYWKIYKGDGPAEPNEKQREVLQAIGFDASSPYAERDERINFDSVFPDGYSKHTLPVLAGELERAMVEEQPVNDDAAAKAHFQKLQQIRAELNANKPQP